jgi:hypothetical protein
MTAPWAEICSDAVWPINSVMHSEMWASCLVFVVSDRKNKNSYTVLTHNRLHSLEIIYILVYLNSQDSMLQVNYLECILYKTSLLSRIQWDLHYVRFEAFTAVNIYSVVFWIMTRYSLTDEYQHFRRTHCLHLLAEHKLLCQYPQCRLHCIITQNVDYTVS